MTHATITPANPRRSADPRSLAAAAFLASCAEPAASERLLIELAVLAALEVGEGTVDSYVLADALHGRRLAAGRADAEWTQGKDYTQHVLREIEHVCRYAVDGSRYRIHHAARYSDACAQHRSRTAVIAVHQPPCPDCFVEALPSGHCPLCSLPVVPRLNLAGRHREPTSA